VSPVHLSHAARGQPERSRAFCLPWLPFGEIGGCQGRRCTKKFGKTAGPLCTMHVGHPRARGSNPPKEKKFFSKKISKSKRRETFFADRVLRGPGSVGIALVPRGSCWRCSGGRGQWGSHWYHVDRVGGAQRAGISGDRAGTAGITLEVLRGPGSVGIALVPRGSCWRCSEGRGQWGSRWYHVGRVGGAQRAWISGDRVGTTWDALEVLRGPGSVGIALLLWGSR
jgi:hypothetical protein